MDKIREPYGAETLKVVPAEGLEPPTLALRKRRHRLYRSLLLLPRFF